MATPTGMPAEVQRQIPPPELPMLEDCLDARQAPEEVRRVAPLLERFGTRIDPAYVGWAVGKPSGSGIIQGWFKLADDRPPDPPPSRHRSAPHLPRAVTEVHPICPEPSQKCTGEVADGYQPDPERPG